MLGFYQKFPKYSENYLVCVNKISVQKLAANKYSSTLSSPPPISCFLPPSLFPLAPLCDNECNKMSIIDIRNGGPGCENREHRQSSKPYYKANTLALLLSLLGIHRKQENVESKVLFPCAVCLVVHPLLLRLILRSLLIDTKRPINQLLMLFAPQIRFQNPVSSQLEQEAHK